MTSTVSEVPISKEKRDTTIQELETATKFDKDHTFALTVKIVAVVSILAEDLTALFLQSHEFDDKIVFWIMYGFGCLSACFGFIALLNQYVSPILLILLEITQSLLFIWVCDWKLTAVISMTLFVIIQIISEIYLGFRDKSDTDNNTQGTILHTHISNIHNEPPPQNT